MVLEIGRVCVKIAGRNSGKICVVVDKVDKNFVIIDGEIKRKRCNISHLEPLDKILKIKKNASTSEIKELLKKEKLLKEEKKFKREKKKALVKEVKKEEKKEVKKEVKKAKPKKGKKK